MIAGWLLLLVSLSYVGLLFVVAWAGSRRLRGTRLRALVHALALAVYCSSWTFYGAVGTAARSGLNYLPIYLGPTLLFVGGFGLLQRLVRVARQRNVTSIADFIGARFGKSHGLAALVTLIAIIAVVPYLALQFKAVAMSYALLHVASAPVTTLPLGHDPALWCALLLALFAILFGTRGVDASEHHHGLILAIALESVIKLLAFVTLAIYACRHGPGLLASLHLPANQAVDVLRPGFIAQTLLGFCAMFCLPRQFQVLAVECEDAADVRRARWLIPSYMMIVSVAVLPIVAAGTALPAVRDGSGDAWLLNLPLFHGDLGVALLAYIGGFSAATGMVIMAAVTLSIMISNDLVMPALLRIRRLRLEQRSDLSRIVLRIRRCAIVALALLAYGYYRQVADVKNLAATGLLSLAAVVQFAPAIVSGLYWRNASRRGLIVGLCAGFAMWCYTFLLPSMCDGAAWLSSGPLGAAWLRPQALFGLTGWDPVVHGVFWSLLVNVGSLIYISWRWPPSLEERLHGALFVNPDLAEYGAGDWRGRVTTADLLTIAERIVGERNAQRVFADHNRSRDRPLQPHEAADRALIQTTERLLAGAVGAASARRILMGVLSGSGLDIAEAVALMDEASQELRFNRQLLFTTLENVSQGISVVDGQMRLVAWNRRYRELFDYPEGMIHVGMPVADLIRWNAEHGECGPGEVTEHVAKRIRHLRAGSPHVFQRVRPDGTVIEMRGRALPDGGYVTTYSDVTAYKRAEQALIEANETLEQRVEQRTAELREALAATAQARRTAELANLSKTRFLAAASHDLLQPLNAARLFTSALRQQPSLDAESTQLAERIDASFRAAEDLLDALLDISRLDTGSYHPDITNFALADLFDSLKTQFAALAEQRGLQLKVMPTRLGVRSDPQLLRRILQNFLSNALRYTSSGSVLMGVRRAGNQVRIEVWDTGPGIAEAQKARIFGEFQRLDRPSPWGEKGLGLGLSICDRIAHILGHTLSLHSREQHGSCFAISVPRTAVVRQQRRMLAVQGAHPQEQLPLTVLCLDDDAAILDGMRALLQRWGVECRTALNLAQAEAEMRRGPVDLLLVDYHLADDCDGLSALQLLHDVFDDLPPAAMITANGSAELKQRARKLGYPILHKPVRPAALRALLTSLLRRQGMHTPDASDDNADVPPPEANMGH